MVLRRPRQILQHCRKSKRVLREEGILKQLLTKYEHGNTKYGATEVEKFQELRNKGLTVKQIITEMKLNTSVKTLGKFLQRNGIKKAKK